MFFFLPADSLLPDCHQQAGRIPSFDALVTSFLSASADTRDSVIAQAKEAAAELTAATDTAAAAYYLKVMQKASTSSDWIQTELARLQKMAAKRSAMAGKQIDDLQVRPDLVLLSVIW